MKPQINAQDRMIWRQWRRACLAHASTQEHAHRVDEARRIIERMEEQHPAALLSWSAGKDSTVLVHLALSLGAEGRIFSIKDDLDFPGEDDYLRHLASKWGALDRLDIVRPPFSLRRWLEDHADELVAGQDLHGSASQFADAAFYGVIRAYKEEHDVRATYLGLRAEESQGRAKNVASRGEIYTKRDGETVCQPLAHWVGLDVYAYLFTHEIPLLSVYRCVRLSSSPDRVRKSWWLPGAHATHGAGVWLRTYYPALWRELVTLFPAVESTA